MVVMTVVTVLVVWIVGSWIGGILEILTLTDEERIERCRREGMYDDE